MTFGNKFVDLSEVSATIKHDEVDAMGMLLVASNPPDIGRRRSKIERLDSHEDATVRLLPYFIDDLYPFPRRTFGLTDVFGLHVDSEIRG